ncbi:retinol dehydrogenase 12 [Orussus abietinus]|uniref:retinol dehydrogenase 12 n=1 Tax=Orussus abietinus TaxID=222816 RepID=UPI0006261804|nr:retinol dehydrogenase 12 [Orussus abietinus]
MWPFSRSCRSKARLVGKTVVITGANTGIGKETARDLYRRGARVILACRDVAKAHQAVEELKETSASTSNREQFKGGPGELVVRKLDLCSLAGVRKCAKALVEEEPAIHILINNAGVMMAPFSKTEDNFESHIQTNHLGPFLFTLLLLPKLKASGPGCRVVNVASDFYMVGNIHFEDLNMERNYKASKAYAQSKLANILFTTELARRLKEAKIEGITAYSLHPGVVSTELSRHVDSTLFPGARMMFKMLTPVIKSPQLGAQTTIYCVVEESIADQSGFFYKECARVTPFRKATDPEVAAKLWKESTRFVGLEDSDDLNKLLETASEELSSSKM